MTPTTQSSSGSTNATTPLLDRAKRLASTLLSERGEASGAQVARELHHVLRALDAGGRHSFQRYLATEFKPDPAALRTAAEIILQYYSEDPASPLRLTAVPPRRDAIRPMTTA